MSDARANDFGQDDAWQRAMRDSVLVPRFYQAFARRFVLIDPVTPGDAADQMQRRFKAGDTLVEWGEPAWWGRDRVELVEEKIVRWPGRAYTAICFETRSCTVAGHESPGWGTESRAGVLLYCFATESGALDCLVIKLWPELARFVVPNAHRYPVHREKTRNMTESLVVPIADIADARLLLGRVLCGHDAGVVDDDVEDEYAFLNGSAE